MKTAYHYLYLMIASIMICSCGEVKEEIWIDDKDNIKLDLSWDMMKQSASNQGGLSSLLSMVSSMMPKEVTEKLTITTMEKLGIKHNGKAEIDSTIFFKDIPYLKYSSLLQILNEKDTKNALNRTEREKLAKAADRFSKVGYARCIVNPSKNQFQFFIKTGKFSIDDFNTLSESLYKLNTAYNYGVENIFADCDDKILFSVDKKRFTRGSCHYSNIFSMEPGSRFANDSKMSMIFGKDKSYDFISIVHLPGKVSKVTNTRSNISGDGTSVSTRISSAQMQNGESPTTTINYK